MCDYVIALSYLRVNVCVLSCVHACLLNCLITEKKIHLSVGTRCVNPASPAEAGRTGCCVTMSFKHYFIISLNYLTTLLWASPDNNGTCWVCFFCKGKNCPMSQSEEKDEGLLPSNEEHGSQANLER